MHLYTEVISLQFCGCEHGYLMLTGSRASSDFSLASYQGSL